jgi:hypothetical protein
MISVYSLIKISLIQIMHKTNKKDMSAVERTQNGQIARKTATAIEITSPMTAYPS